MAIPIKEKVIEKKNIMGLTHQNNVPTNIVPPHITDKDLKTPKDSEDTHAWPNPKWEKRLAVGTWQLEYINDKDTFSWLMV